MLASRMLFLSAAFALAFVVTAGTMSAPALADKVVHIYFGGDSGDDDDDDDVVVYVTPGGDLYAVIYDRYTGKANGWVDLPDGNPDPDGGSTGLAPDVQKLIDALLKAGGTMHASPDFYNTFFGRMLTAKGLTIVPVHNPTDVGYEIDGYGSGGGGYDPLGGGIQEHIAGLKKKGGGKGEDDDDNNNGGGKSSTDDVFGYDMPANPEIVNPAPINRAAGRPRLRTSMALPRQRPAGAVGSRTAVRAPVRTVVGTLR